MRWWLENRVATLQIQFILLIVIIVGAFLYGLIDITVRWLF